VVTAATLGLIAVSVVVHGVSATPVAPPTAATRVKAAARRMLEWRMQRKPSDLNGRR
jgi:NhaP-type Na+/H+ or K+/H+ antiporter